MGRPPARARTWTGATLLAVTALAAVFRLHMLDTVPPGLYLDETLNAQHAIAWRLGAHKAWFEGTPPIPGVWADVPNLYLAGVSGVLRLFGDGFLATRMTSVVPSLACVPLLYALARSVTGRRQALLAAGLLAVSHWAARTGRDGTYEVAMTALQLAGLASLGRALARDRLVWSALAGVLLGASIYTYTAARLVLAQAGVWLGWELVASAERRRTLAHAGLCLAVALLCAAPYAVYLATRSAGDLGVLALTGPAAPHGVLGTLAENVAAHLAMFNLRGGTYARDNLPGWPMLDPVTGLLFLAGLLVALRRADRQRRLVVTWYAVCVLGGVLSLSREGPPYVYRVANLGPWACLVAAAGAVAAWDRLRPRVSGPVAVLGALGGLGVAGARPRVPTSALPLARPRPSSGSGSRATRTSGPPTSSMTRSACSTPPTRASGIPRPTATTGIGPSTRRRPSTSRRACTGAHRSTPSTRPRCTATSTWWRASRGNSPARPCSSSLRRWSMPSGGSTPSTGART